MSIDGAGTVNNSGCLYAGPCPNTMTRSATVTSLGLPDGANTVNVTARDASYFSARNVSAQHQTSKPVAVRLDRDKPAISPSGSLYDARSAFIGADRDYTLNVTATDGDASSPSKQRSGVTSLSATLDGQPISGGSASAPCTRPEGSCSLSINAILSKSAISQLVEQVAHTVTIVATDAVGHTSDPVTFTFRIDKSNPDIYASGTLWDLDRDQVADDQVTVDLDATDGDDTYPSSGLDHVSVAVDETQVASTPATGCGTSNCQQSTSFTLKTSDYSEGPHTLTYTATDRVGLTDTETETINIKHIASQPTDSHNAASSSALRIDGANGSVLGLGGDRVGSSVADIGDINADNADDYAVGAPGASNAAGAVYVVYGGQQGSINVSSLSPNQGFAITGGPTEAAGTAVAAAGDVDGDGTPDLVVGAPGNSVLNSLVQGHVYVLFGGRCLRNIDLSSLGSCGFAITGPSATLTGLLSSIPGFGSQLAGPHAGDSAPMADVNGDGLDDVVIGSPRDGQQNRDKSGSTYIIYGKTDSAAVDVNSLAAQGFRIDGAIANDQSGTSAAVVGDVNADGYADIGIGAPNAASTGTGETAARSGSGKAWVAYGSATPSNLDLAGINGYGYPVLGAAGDKLGTSISGLGDLDSDGIDDLAFGGRGAYVITGHDNSDDAIDLANPDLSGWRLAPPTAAGSDALVAGATDLNDDGLSDLIVAYPSLERSYNVYTQDGLINKLPQAGAVDGSPGQRSTRYTAGQSGDGTAAAVDSVPTLQDGRSGSIIGAPSANTRAGSAYVAAAPPSSPTAAAPSGTPTTQTAAPRPPADSTGIIREKGCAPVRGWQFFDRPEAAGTGGLLPQSFHFYNCVKTGLSNRITTPRNEGCGKNDPKGCKQTKYRAPKAYGFQGRMRVRKQIVDDDLPIDSDGNPKSNPEDHMALVVDKNSPADRGTPVPQDPTDTDKREYAWRMQDSFGTGIGYIRELPKKAATATSPAIPAHTYRIWNDSKQFMGTTNPFIGRMTVEGRPCATSTVNPEATALIFLGDNSAATEAGPLNGNFLTVRALLNRRALPSNALTAKVSNDKAIDAYWAPCKRPKKLPRTTPDPAGYSAPNFQAPNDSLYLSFSGARSLRYNNAYNQGGPGTPLLNYTWPQQAAAAGRPQYPPFAVLTPSPTTVTLGGLTRGVMVNRSVAYLDGFKYLDPNLICGVHENWSWSLIRASGIYAFVPRKTGDGNGDLPAARPSAFDPSKPDNPKQILESYRPCR